MTSVEKLIRLYEQNIISQTALNNALESISNEVNRQKENIPYGESGATPPVQKKQEAGQLKISLEKTS